MDGYEVARRLRADSALAGVPLVATTGSGRDENRERSRAVGFDQQLVKPLDLDAHEARLAAQARKEAP